MHTSVTSRINRPTTYSPAIMNHFMGVLLANSQRFVDQAQDQLDGDGDGGSRRVAQAGLDVLVLIEGRRLTTHNEQPIDASAECMDKLKNAGGVHAVRFDRRAGPRFGVRGSRLRLD